MDISKGKLESSLPGHCSNEHADAAITSTLERGLPYMTDEEMPATHSESEEDVKNCSPANESGHQADTDDVAQERRDSEKDDTSVGNASYRAPCERRRSQPIPVPPRPLRAHSTQLPNWFPDYLRRDDEWNGSAEESPVGSLSQPYPEATVDTTEPAAPQVPARHRRLPPPFHYERYRRVHDDDDILGVQAADDQNSSTCTGSAGGGKPK